MSTIHSKTKTKFRVFCGHTSHGSQIISGMEMLRTSLYDFNNGPGTLSIEEVSGDLGGYGDLTWATTTRVRLNQPGSDINLVMWSWCGSWDPAGNFYPDTSDDCSWCATWCETHTCPGCAECAHSHCFNCYLKGKAFWWMVARLAGWQPGRATAPASLLLSD